MTRVGSEPGRPANRARDVEDRLIDAAATARLFGGPIAPVRIGRYRILRRIGQGAMGVVYAAHDDELDRSVAIKIIRRSVHPEFRVRASEEARALARFKDPHVVAVYDVGTDEDDDIWIAMEYVAGRTLGAWAKERPRDWREVWPVAIGVARGIKAAHAHDMIHGDLKPENVMIDGHDHVRILDFGLAHVASATSTSDSRSSTRPSASPTVRLVGGTLGYMAPEQAAGEDVGPEADQFAWSVMTYQLLYGELPYVTRSGLMTPRRRQPPPGIKIPRWLSRVIERGLALDPRARYPTMTALLAELEAGAPRYLKALALAAGLTGMVILALTLHHIDRQEKLAGCLAEGVVAVTWNDSVREGLRAGLVRSGASYAESTANSIEPRIDEYAANWQAARTRVCIAEIVEETIPAERAEQTRRCLDEAQHHLDTLITRLSNLTADATSLDVVTSAVVAVAGLPPLVACEDEARLRMRPLSPDERSFDEIGRIRGILSEATALGSLGLVGEGLVLAESARRDADALGWTPLVAEAELCRGDLLDRSGDHAAGEAALEAAHFMASTADDDRVFIASAIALTHVTVDMGHLTDGVRWGRAAHARLMRSPSAGDDVVWAELYSSLGLLHLARGRYSEAVTMHRSALERRERAYGTVHPYVADDLINIADSYRLLGETDRALELANRAFELQELTLGLDHPTVTDALAQLSVLYTDVGAHAQALDLITQVLDRYQRALGPEHPLIGVALNNIGSIHLRMRQPRLALAVLGQARTILERSFGPMHPEVATTLYSMALAEGELGTGDRGLELVNEALRIWRATLEPGHPMIGNALNQLCNLHGERGDLKLAVDTCRQALASYDAALGPQHPSTQIALSNLGQWLVEDRQYSEARPILERALAEQGGDDPGSLGSLQLALARALWSLKEQRARAQELALQSLDNLGRADASYADDLSEAKRWLATHGLLGPAAGDRKRARGRSR